MEQTTQEYLDIGLKDLWYPVIASWELGAEPLGITRLEENIVLWRDKSGVVSAIEDRCPHRGARLSMGWNLGDRVACWYHGVEVDGKGIVQDVPAVKSCPIIGTECLRSYPVIEKHGVIFVYFGATDAAVAALNFPQELEDEAFSHFVCTANWQCNYQYAIDNVMDPMHGAYLHAVSHSMDCGDKSAEMHIVNKEKGFIFEKINQSGVNFDWVEFVNDGGVFLKLSIPYKKRFGYGGEFFIVGMVVPVDRDNCRVFFWRIRKVQGFERNVWRFMYRTHLEKLHWDVLEQDRVVLENLAPNARHKEFLYAHDSGMSRVRRLMKKAAESQIAHVANAVSPPAN